MAVKIEADNTSTQDVTDEFVDNEARLTTLKLAEASTQKLMDRADSMDKIFSVQRELNTIRTEIEKIQGRQNYIQRRVAVSTIRVRLSVEIPPPPVVTAQARSGFEPGTTARVAWETSLNFLSGVATVLITLFVVLWWVFPLALILWWAIRRYFVHKRAKELAKLAEKRQTNPT
jgi:Flp pilus assembly protein TadB